MIRHFVGSKGGGGGSPPAPVRTPDNLRSEDSVEILLAVSEGPIVGLENGAKTFYVGDTQLENNDNTSNFDNFSLTEYTGAVREDIKMTLGGNARSTNVNVQLFYNTPVVRQTLFGDIDYIDVRVIITRLYFQDDTGIYNNDIQFKLEYKPLSEPDANYQSAFFDASSTIHGKTTSNYVKQVRFAVSRINEPYQIRMTKLSAESDSTENFHDMIWESFQEIQSDTKAFDNLYCIRALGKASNQFSSIPDFSGIYKGRTISVPNNYDPVAHTTSGIWDGTFVKDWTDNGPWILYDFVSNTTYGINAYFPVTMDAASVYEVAAWCDQQVDDGKGGTEPRWTFNALISEAQSGKEMARYIAGTFNGVFFDDLNGTAILKVDKDDAALHLFTPENVVDGTFEYSYTDLTSRYNDITVAFANPDLNWAEDRRRVFDQADIDLNGRVPYEFVAVGCIKEREALRRAQYKLITSLTECEIVKFKTNRLGQNVQPFDVMLVGDPDMGYSLTGRFKTYKYGLPSPVGVLQHTVADKTLNGSTGSFSDGGITISDGAELFCDGIHPQGGTAVNFTNGADGQPPYQAVGFGNSTVFDSPSFTYEMRIKPNEIRGPAGSGNYNVIIGRENYLTAGFRAGIYQDGRLTLWTTQSGGTLNVYTDPGVIKVGTKSHIAFAYDSATSTLRIVVDGVTVATGTGTYIAPVGQHLAIGTAIGGSQGFFGIADDVRAWDHSRTDAELAANKDVVLNGDESGLVGYWPMDDVAVQTITLRDPVYLEVGVDYTMRGYTRTGGLFQRTVTAASSGYVTSLTTDTRLPWDVPDHMTFSLEQTGAGYGAPKPYRVTSISEVDGSPDQFEIQGIEINRNKWNDVDNLTSSGTVTYSVLPTPFVIPPPSDVHFYSAYFRGVKENHLTVTPIFDKAAYPYYNGQFDIYSRPQDLTDGWKKWTLVNGDTIINHPSGAYEFRILPYNYFGGVASLNNVTSFNYTVAYTVIPPASVSNFTSSTTYAGLILAWDQNTEPDLEYYEIREGSSWDSGTVVVTGLTSNRYIFPKKKIGTITYLICARASGKFSQPTALTINVLAPATARDFQVVQNNDTLVFTWAPNTEPDIEAYEIREGTNWVSGRKIAETTGTMWTIPSNLNAQRSFWIKARDKSKNLSVNADQALSVITPTDRYNYWFTSDEQAGGFPHHKINTTVDLSGFLTIPSGKYYGEYVFPINLGAEIYARNVMKSAVSVQLDDSLTWAGATFAWNSADARRPWVTSGDIDSVTFEEFYAVDVGLGVSDIEGFRLNGSLVGVGSTAPNASANISYAAGRFDDGLDVGATTTADWSVAIPSAFEMNLWYRPQAVGAGTRNIVTLTGSGGLSLTLNYDGDTDEFVLVDNSSQEIRVAGFGDMAVDDLIYIDVIQTSTTRKLYLGRLHDSSIKSGTAAYAPVGALTTWAVNGAQAVISDVLFVTGGDVTIDDFTLDLGRVSPPGYTDFKPFIPGDYKYTNALFRYVMIPTSSDRPKLQELSLAVDVPDVIDRGNYSVPASAGTVINFNRTFLAPPELSITMKNAPDTAREYITSITKTSFTIDVLNSSNANVAADITWIAHGY